MILLCVLVARAIVQANPFPKDCPKTDLTGMDALEDPALYDDVAAPASPILDAAAKAPKLV